jgi:hypothetical protein
MTLDPVALRLTRRASEEGVPVPRLTRGKPRWRVELVWIRGCGMSVAGVSFHPPEAMRDGALPSRSVGRLRRKGFVPGVRAYQ